MARLPIGRGAGNRSENNSENSRSTFRRPMNLDELTRRATYIVDDAGKKQAIVVEWAAWQDFVRQAGAEDGSTADSPSSPGTNTGATPAPKTAATPRGEVADAGYALQPDRARVDLYRPKPASDKEAADFTLESNVTRRTRD
ncbi:MAG: hypothetical protein WDZ49_01115 [Litorilinea sp.]